MSNFALNTKSKNWLVTHNVKSMEKMGLKEEQYKNPEFLAQALSDQWSKSGKGRTCAVAVCVSANGLYHAHIACNGNTTTLKRVSEIFCDSHVEPQLGGKKELTAYITKQGKYAEKGEKVLYTMGLENIKDKQGMRSDLDEIDEMLNRGFTPKQIMMSNIKYYRYSRMIRQAYSDLRISQSPIKHDIYCEYHIGESGTGKTHTYNELCKTNGVDNIYVVTDFDNNSTGGFDTYMDVGAPSILFIDEFKGEGISYQKLLTILNGYTHMQTHSRYANTYNLWEKVYITSIYPPEELYELMVPESKRYVDSYKQLKRRISKIVYHYIEDGIYKTFEMASDDYIDYEDLKCRVHPNDFENISESEQIEMPFS